MIRTIAVGLMVGALTIIHLRIRRNPRWKSSADARFYITSGYPLVAIAVYFLSSSTEAAADWTWIVGNLWAFIAVVSFVHGFDALNADGKRGRAPVPEVHDPQLPLSKRQNYEAPPAESPSRSANRSASTSSPRKRDRVARTLPTTGRNGR